MKGVFLQLGLEIRLEVTGEDFVQGVAVPCKIIVKNHSDELRSVARPCLHLALGNTKKVKAKSDDAFKVLESAALETIGELAARCEQSYSWTFQLDKNCPVSDKGQSLYLLYGTSENLTELGQLPLTVNPHLYFAEVFKTMEMVFQFVPKGNISKDGWTISKLKPPTSRKFSFVEELNLSCRFVEESLELRYVFSVKKFDAGGSKGEVKKEKSEIVQTLSNSQYLFAGQFINQESLESAINSALSEVSSNL